jgi:hypothetical protein
MATIYELTEQAKILLDHLLFEEDDQEALKMLDTVYGTVENKLKFVSTLYAESLALDAGYDAALKQLQERKKASDRTIKRFKDYLTFGMTENNIKRIDGEYISLRLQANPPSVKYAENFDATKLQDKFIKIIPAEYKPVASAIKEAIKNGEDVPGCWIEQAVGIRVY